MDNRSSFEETERMLKSYRSDWRRIAFARKYLDPNAFLELEESLERLEYAVSLLPDPDCKIIRSIYFDGLTWFQTASRFHVSESTVARARVRAIDILITLYSYTTTTTTTTSTTTSSTTTPTTNIRC